MRGSRRSRAFVAAGAAVVVLGLVAGWVAARAVDSYLAVEFRDKVPLAGTAPQAQLADSLPAGQARPTTVELPSGTGDDPLLALAVQRFPGASDSAADGEPLTVEAVLDPSADLGDEGYRWQSTAVGQVTVTASDRRGLGQGLFRLADRAVAGSSDAALRAAADEVRPAADVRLIDFGAAGIPIDPEAYLAQDDYSHVLGFLSEALLAEAPYLDPDAMVEVERTWRDHVDQSVAYGYNGVVVPGFLEYVTFAGVGDGETVYAPGSPHYERALAMREGMAPLWDYAQDMGLSVIMSTDMLALTTPLESYLRETTGGLDASDPRLWEVYRSGVDELLREIPAVDGLMIRIGEAGGIYNAAGWDYYSRLAVTSPDEVQTMLAALTAAAEPHGAEIVFRTWSVGVGEVGDLHTNPETYDRVVGPADAENLVVSTKLVSGDFDAYLPLNPTLMTGDQRRIMEVQARREFEAFSAFPNVVSGDTQAALQQVRAETGQVPGVWVWSQGGGPQRAGPMTLYLREGFWQLYDLDVWLSARLAWDPDTDLGVETATWIERTWTADPAAVADLGQLLELSRQATLDGMYIGPFAEQDVRAFGLEPPPMLWIFKWDLVSGDTASWTGIAKASEGRVDEAVEQGQIAVAAVDRMIGLLAGVDRDTFRDPAQYDALEASLEYQRDLFVTLGAWRETALRYYEWADTGSPQAWSAYRAAAAEYAVNRDAHVARWTGNVALPPFEFRFADAGFDAMQATPAATWLARGALLVAVLALVGVRPLRRGAFTPWQLGASGWRDLRRWQRLAVVGVPAVVLVAGQAAFSSFQSATYLALGVGLPVAGVAALMGAAWLAAGRGAAGTALVAAAGAHTLVGALLPAAMSLRGPLAAWYGFWIDPTGRTAFVVLAVAGLLWLLAAPALALLAARHVLAGILPAAGAVTASAGAPLLVLGAVVGRAGTETFLTDLNDELAIVPNGLSRILGITVHLGVPTSLPDTLMTAGGVLVGAGLALAGLATVIRRFSGTRGRPVTADSSPSSDRPTTSTVA